MTNEVAAAIENAYVKLEKENAENVLALADARVELNEALADLDEAQRNIKSLYETIRRLMDETLPEARAERDFANEKLSNVRMAISRALGY